MKKVTKIIGLVAVMLALALVFVGCENITNSGGSKQQAPTQVRIYYIPYDIRIGSVYFDATSSYGYSSYKTIESGNQKIYVKNTYGNYIESNYYVPITSEKKHTVSMSNPTQTTITSMRFTYTED